MNRFHALLRLDFLSDGVLAFDMTVVSVVDQPTFEIDSEDVRGLGERADDQPRYSRCVGVAVTSRADDVPSHPNQCLNLLCRRWLDGCPFALYELCTTDGRIFTLTAQV